MISLIFNSTVQLPSAIGLRAFTHHILTQKYLT